MLLAEASMITLNVISLNALFTQTSSTTVALTLSSVTLLVLSSINICSAFIELNALIKLNALIIEINETVLCNKVTVYNFKASLIIMTLTSVINNFLSL